MCIPNMCSEIIEAIHLTYEDYPDVETDCLLFLSYLKNDKISAKKISDKSFYQLKEMGRCPFCGTIMKTYHYQERHSEVEYNSNENFYELYCPNCNIRSDDM